MELSQRDNSITKFCRPLEEGEETGSRRPLSATQLRPESPESPETYPESLNTSDPYEVFAYDMVEKIVRER